MCKIFNLEGINGKLLSSDTSPQRSFEELQLWALPWLGVFLSAQTEPWHLHSNGSVFKCTVFKHFLKWSECFFPSSTSLKLHWRFSDQVNVVHLSVISRQASSQRFSAFLTQPCILSGLGTGTQRPRLGPPCSFWDK